LYLPVACYMGSRLFPNQYSVPERMWSYDEETVILPGPKFTGSWQILPDSPLDAFPSFEIRISSKVSPSSYISLCGFYTWTLEPVLKVKGGSIPFYGGVLLGHVFEVIQYDPSKPSGGDSSSMVLPSHMKLIDSAGIESTNVTVQKNAKVLNRGRPDIPKTSQKTLIKETRAKLESENPFWAKVFGEIEEIDGAETVGQWEDSVSEMRPVKWRCVGSFSGFRVLGEDSNLVDKEVNFFSSKGPDHLYNVVDPNQESLFRIFEKPSRKSTYSPLYAPKNPQLIQNMMDKLELKGPTTRRT